MEVCYVFGDESGYGFSLSWNRPGSKALSYRFVIWGVEGDTKPSNLREFRKLFKILEGISIREDLEGGEIFLFTKNTLCE